MAGKEETEEQVFAFSGRFFLSTVVVVFCHPGAVKTE